MRVCFVFEIESAGAEGQRIQSAIAHTQLCNQLIAAAQAHGLLAQHLSFMNSTVQTVEEVDSVVLRSDTECVRAVTVSLLLPTESFSTIHTFR